MQIAIDTSTDIASLALMQDGTILSELTWHCGQNHTIELYPRLDFLLSMSSLSMPDADCIFVAKGPGSFNGLRVGVSAAKGLAYSLGIPIIGISTLELTAFQYALTGLPVCAVQNAGREEIASALYQKKPRKGWTQLKAEHITTLAVLLNQVKEKTIICGDINPSTIAQIKKIIKGRVIIPSPSGQLRRAAYLAELGWLRQKAGDFDNLATLQPIYLRKPPITERKKA